jgi:hypothetical protein
MSRLSLKFLAGAIIAAASFFVGNLGASAAPAKPQSDQSAKIDVGRSSSTKPGNSTTAVAGSSLPAGSSIANGKSFSTDGTTDHDILSYMNGTSKEIYWNGRTYKYDTTTTTYIEVLTPAELETRSPRTIEVTEWNGTKGKFTEHIPLPWPYSGPPTPVDHTVEKI